MLPGGYTGKVFGELTPAHTGNAPMWVVSQCQIGAHPRAYGECLVQLVPVRPLLSSPPRIRGTLNGSGEVWARIKLTPAHKGNAEVAL